MYTVLYNQGFSSLLGVFRNIWQSYSERSSSKLNKRPIQVIALHRAPRHPLQAFALLDQEPQTEDADQYAEQLLQLAEKHQAILIVPTRNAIWLADRDVIFKKAGIGLLSVSSADNLRKIENKASFYALESNSSSSLITPFARPVKTLQEAVTAAEMILAMGEMPCVKPSKGIYGEGFRVLNPQIVDELKYLATQSQADSSLAILPLLIDAWWQGCRMMPQKTPPSVSEETWLVMTHCTGIERSIDCLAQQGQLIHCVIRKKTKEARIQWIEDNPDLTGLITDLVRRWTLHGAFNVQTIEHKGCNYLLEINARLSGGSVMSALSGLDVGVWAVLLELGLAASEEVPQPKTGLTVAMSDNGLTIPD